MAQRENSADDLAQALQEQAARRQKWSQIWRWFWGSVLLLFVVYQVVYVALAFVLNVWLPLIFTIASSLLIPLVSWRMALKRYGEVEHETSALGKHH